MGSIIRSLLRADARTLDEPEKINQTARIREIQLLVAEFFRFVPADNQPKYL
jgi:hypothetical protein